MRCNNCNKKIKMPKRKWAKKFPMSVSINICRECVIFVLEEIGKEYVKNGLEASTVTKKKLFQDLEIQV